MFTKRHEQELAEIKALTHELDRRMQEILEQLRDIQRAQGRVPSGDKPGSDAGRGSAKPTGAKKGRPRQAPTPVVAAGGAKAGKRRGPRKRRQAEPARASEEQ